MTLIPIFRPSSLIIQPPQGISKLYKKTLSILSYGFNELFKDMFKIILDDMKLPTTHVKKSIAEVMKFESKLLKTYWDYGHFNATANITSIPVYLHDLAAGMTSVSFL